MRYAGIIKNDLTAAPGVSVSFFTQGCPHHCNGCHNPETWDFEGGREFTQDVINDIVDAIDANGIRRTFCIMGGEPLCPENQFLVKMVIGEVKKHIPDIKIYIWTGYEMEELQDKNSQEILAEADCVITGRYVDSLRDITLPMRGSSNQKVIYLKD